MNRTSLVLALVVPSLLFACGAGENTVGTEAELPDAGNAQDTSNASDSCTGCAAGGAKLVLSAPEVCLSAPVGKQSKVATFDVANTGSAAIGPLTAVLSGAAAASFIITSNTCSGAALPPAATCQVAVAYAPAAAHANAESATLTVADAQTSVDALLRGSDIGTVVVSPAALDFGSVAAGSTSAEVMVQVTTTSTCGTTWTAAVDNPSFVISSNTCTGRLSSPCLIGVRMAPPAGPNPTTSAGFLTLTASDSGTASVALTGVISPIHPTPPTLAASPAALDFGEVIVGESGTGTITVNWAAATPTVVISGSAPFSIVANTCTAPAETCTIQIKFAPTVAGASSATLNISDGQIMATVALQGKGLAASVTPPFAVMPAALDFGQVSVGVASSPLIVTVTTIAARTFKLTLSDSAISEVSIVEETCTAPVPAGGACTISLTYKPAKVSKLNGVLNISDGTGVAAVTLAGEGWTLL